MALQSTPGVWVGELFPTVLDTTTFLLDASGEKAAQIIKVPKTGNLWKVGFRTGTVVQEQTIRVSFQDVVAGVPDEIQDQYRDISIADTDDSAWKLTGILSADGTDGGAKRAVTRGDFVAVVWEHNPFNTGAIFRLAGYGRPANFAYGSQYAALKTGGTWAKNATGLVLLLLYDDGSAYYIPGMLPASALSVLNFNSGSSPPKRGMRFRLPVACALDRVMVQTGVVSSTAADWDLKLYSEAGALLATAAPTPHDADIIRGTAAQYPFEHHFAAPVNLSANTNYYLMLEPTTVNGVYLVCVDVDQAAYLAQIAGGVDFYYAECSVPGTWTFNTARRPAMILGLSSLEDGAGGAGSGMLVHPGMAGGMRG